MDRRELLKYFGIGSTITPIVGGSPIVEAAAKLVSVPEVQPLVVTSAFPHGWLLRPNHVCPRCKAENLEVPRA